MLEFYEPQADFGTPEIESETMVTLSIDGADVTVPEGTSVMRAAAEKGIKIPRLCATDSLKSFGSCRVCLVEIEGRRGFPASCTTNVEEGMQVITQSSEIGMKCMSISIRKNCNRFNAHLACRFNNSTSNFATVCNKNFIEHHTPLRLLRIKSFRKINIYQIKI